MQLLIIAQRDIAIGAVDDSTGGRQTGSADEIAARVTKAVDVRTAASSAVIDGDDGPAEGDQWQVAGSGKVLLSGLQ